jgi:hypothetical protein
MTEAQKVWHAGNSLHECRKPSFFCSVVNICRGLRSRALYLFLSELCILLFVYIIAAKLFLDLMIFLRIATNILLLRNLTGKLPKLDVYVNVWVVVSICNCSVKSAYSAFHLCHIILSMEIPVSKRRVWQTRSVLRNYYSLKIIFLDSIRGSWGLAHPTSLTELALLDGRRPLPLGNVIGLTLLLYVIFSGSIF